MRNKQGNVKNNLRLLLEVICVFEVLEFIAL
jgi:hypothetical protein